LIAAPAPPMTEVDCFCKILHLLGVSNTNIDILANSTGFKLTSLKHLCSCVFETINPDLDATNATGSTTIALPLSKKFQSKTSLPLQAIQLAMLLQTQEGCCIFYTIRTSNYFDHQTSSSHGVSCCRQPIATN